MLLPIHPNCLLMNGAVPFDNSYLEMSFHEGVCFHSSAGFFVEIVIFHLRHVPALNHGLNTLPPHELFINWQYVQMGIFIDVSICPQIIS